MSESTRAIDGIIAFYMFEQKLTVEKMAALLGMSANTLRAKRSGERPWVWDEILHLSELTGKTLDELAGM